MFFQIQLGNIYYTSIISELIFLPTFFISIEMSILNTFISFINFFTIHDYIPNLVPKIDFIGLIKITNNINSVLLNFYFFFNINTITLNINHFISYMINHQFFINYLEATYYFNTKFFLNTLNFNLFATKTLNLVITPIVLNKNLIFFYNPVLNVSIHTVLYFNNLIF